MVNLINSTTPQSAPIEFIQATPLSWSGTFHAWPGTDDPHAVIVGLGSCYFDTIYCSSVFTSHKKVLLTSSYTYNPSHAASSFMPLVVSSL